MIRKFSVTNTQSNQSGSVSTSEAPSTTGSGPIASPTSQLESQISSTDQDSKKLYAQSLESTENSVVNEQSQTMSALVDPLLYPIGSEHDTSTDEGLSMSEEEDQLTPENSELSKIINDLDIDHKLNSAAQRGESELVKGLLLSGAQVVTDETGSTAIHIAAQNGFAEVVRLLLEHGTDVDIPDSSGYTALHKAAGNGHLDVLELLINEGCDIDTQDDMYGNTPLHEAGWHGFSKSVDLLLKNKSNAFITNRAGCTPLHLAAQNGHNQSGRTLLYGGCSPDVKNNYGDTPLHTSARYGHAGIARILISAKCSIGEQNKNGDTSLHITAAFKRRKIAKLLVEAGINTLIKNKQEESAVDIARRKAHPEIIEIIHSSSMQPATTVIEEALPMHSKRVNKLESSHNQKIATLHAHQDPAITAKESKKKSHNALVSWIRKKFSKKPSHNTKCKPGAGGHMDDDNDQTPVNQYVKKPGFAYYRDLAGNVRQGPCGFVPACHCDSTGHPISEEAPAVSKDYTNLKRTQQILSERMAELKQAADLHAKQFGDRTDRQMGAQSKSRDRRPNEADRDRNEINRQLAQVENDLQELRGDLQSWLITQADDGGDFRDNPFAYTVGARQMRFGDDFDHERMARYDATEQFPPPPRLFRSRSDETLSHSEYSYHGRAFKSKEAAMEELKTLKHHEELRARRRRIRAGEEPITTTHYDFGQGSRSNLTQSKNNINRDSLPRNAPPLIRRHSSRPNLWQSRENLLKHDIEVRPEPHGASERPVSSERPQIPRPASEERRPHYENTPSRDRDRDTTPTNDNRIRAHQPNLRHPNDNVDSTPTPMATRATPIGAVQSTPQTRYVATTRQPATYQLISAALNNQNNAHSNPAVSQPDRRPVPAQRSNSVVANRGAVTNNVMLPNRQPNGALPSRPNAGPNQSLPFNKYQQQHQQHQQQPSNNLLYSERRQPVHPSQQPVLRNNNRESHYGVYQSNASVNSARPQPQNYINTPTPQIRRLLPTYEEAKGHKTRAENPYMSHDQISRPPMARPLPSSNNDKMQPMRVSKNTPENLRNGTSDGLVVQTVGESCCSSSNPDSGYGGQNGDFYSNHPSPQNANKPGNEFDSWYNRRLQDAARKMNGGGGGYTGTRPSRTMTSDV